MTELKVNLDFACHACGEPVGVTVKCAGDHLTATARVVAAVLVPCPCCGRVNQVLFEPNGTVRDVRPLHATGRLPEPSVN